MIFDATARLWLMLVGLGILLGIGIGLWIAYFILKHPYCKIARLLLDDGGVG